MKKNFGIMLFAVLLALSLVACGDDDSPIAVSFTDLTANGTSGSVTTTELTLTFSVDPVGLSASHITLTGATKGALTGTGTTRTLAITGIAVANGANVTVTLTNLTGYSITPSSKVVAVNVGPTAVSFTDLTANGTSGSVTTTELTLTFSVDPVGLSASHITLTGATKGALTGTGTTRTLAITGIAVANGGDVTVTLANPAGYSIIPSSKVVAVYKDLLSSLSYRDMVTVPSGSFTQTDNVESFTHKINAFKMGKYEVTYKLWYTVKTWAVANGYLFDKAGCEGHDGTVGAAPTGAQHEPVTSINWRDAIVWCNAYSQMAGLTPVYCTTSGYTTAIKDSRSGEFSSSLNTSPGSFDNPFVNWSATGYRLPTEGQWQYAASYQDGSSWTPHTWASGASADYENEAACQAVAWYSANTTTTKTVGTKTANQLGIYDMSGNVSEWCWDWSGTWPTGLKMNYRGADSGQKRVMRGGSYIRSQFGMLVGDREESVPQIGYNSFGVRVSLPE